MILLHGAGTMPALFLAFRLWEKVDLNKKNGCISRVLWKLPLSVKKAKLDLHFSQSFCTMVKDF